MKQALLSLEDAQARLLALASPLDVVHVDVEGAVGHFLAHPLLARRTQPALDLSAMDGFAVAAANLAGPWRLVGESAAGHPYDGHVNAGEAVRISTGAALPAGADAVIIQEDVSLVGHSLTLTGVAPQPPDKHIRRRGMDFSEGDEVLPSGARIGPAQAALAIAAGHRHLPVRRAPRIVVIDSWDELTADPEGCALHQIPASNGAMLTALAAPLSAETSRLGPVPDTLEALVQALDEAADADVIVTSGGASVGDHDLIRPALQAWGADLDFWRVAIKPGKPILVATRMRPGKSARPQIILGLPGNPVSSFVTAYYFLLPLLRQLHGAGEVLPLKVATTAAAPIRGNGPRREFLRGDWDGRQVVPHPLQDSGALASLAASNVLIDRPAHAPEIGVGDKVEVFLLQNGGIV